MAAVINFLQTKRVDGVRMTDSTTATGAALASGAASTLTSPFANYGFVRVYPDANGWAKVGASPTAAANTAGNVYIAVGEIYRDIPVEFGDKVAWIDA